MKNILVALSLDSSDHSLIPITKQLASKFDSRVWLVHIDSTKTDIKSSILSEQDHQHKDELSEGHKKLQNHVADFKASAIQADGILCDGAIVKTINEQINQHKIDLLIMGEHEHGFPYDTLHGHTSQGILKNLQIPVLIVPLVNKK